MSMHSIILLCIETSLQRSGMFFLNDKRIPYKTPYVHTCLNIEKVRTNGQKFRVLERYLQYRSIEVI